MTNKRNILPKETPADGVEKTTPSKRAYNRSGKFSKANKPNLMDDTAPSTGHQIPADTTMNDYNPDATIADIRKPIVPAPNPAEQVESHANFIASGNDQEADALKKVASQLGITESSAQSTGDYNPMGGDVTARGGHAEIHTDATIQTDIPEFIPPAGTFAPPPPPSQTPPTNTPPPPPLNPEMQNLNPEEARLAAESMVDVIFEVYGLIKIWAGSKVKIDVAGKKLRDLIEKNKIGLDIPLPLPNGDVTTFREIAASFDSQVAETFVVSQSFINKVREPMIREFMKRGIGLTDLQKIGVYWTIELSQTGMQALQFSSLANEIIDRQMQIYAKISGQAPPQAAPTQQAPPVNKQESSVQAESAKSSGQPTDVPFEMVEPEEKDNTQTTIQDGK